jgi:hypothetical protein
MVESPPESFLIAGWQNDLATINRESTNENNTDIYTSTCPVMTSREVSWLAPRSTLHRVGFVRPFFGNFTYEKRCFIGGSAYGSRTQFHHFVKLHDFGGNLRELEC